MTQPEDHRAETRADIRASVRAAADRHRHERGALLPTLHELQADLGYVPPEAIGPLADEFNLSRAEVYGVVSFYRDFRDRPPARRQIRVCAAEACQAVGAVDTIAHIERSLGVTTGETSADGSLELREVFCFGNCALGPSVEIDGMVHGRVDAARFDALQAMTDR